MDERDTLLNATQTFMYSLFDWPGRRTSRLIVLCIANTMDLPELLHRRVLSRMGLQRLIFQAYTKEQIKQIIYSRLQGLKLFQPAAIELAALKINSTFGDARGALQLCKRAIEICQQEQILKQKKNEEKKREEDEIDECDIIHDNDNDMSDAGIRRRVLAKELRDRAKAAERENDEEDDDENETGNGNNELPVTPHHITAALKEMTGSRYTRWLQDCPLHLKIWLASLLNANKVGNEAGQSKHKFLHIASIHDRICDTYRIRPRPTLTDLLSVATQFHDTGICHHEYKGNDRWPIIELKLAEERIVEAFKNDTQWIHMHNATLSVKTKEK